MRLLTASAYNDHWSQFTIPQHYYQLHNINTHASFITLTTNTQLHSDVTAEDNGLSSNHLDAMALRITYNLKWSNKGRIRPVQTFSLLGAMASSSSMKMMAGAFFSASSNAFLRLLSDSPASLLIISGPLMRKKNAPVSLATARAIRVLPVPGGPYSRIPRGGYIINRLASTSINQSIIWQINQSIINHQSSGKMPASQETQD